MGRCTIGETNKLVALIFREVARAGFYQADQERGQGAAITIAYLSSFDAEMHVADISKEAEEAIDEAADNEAIAQAVETEFSDE